MEISYRFLVNKHGDLYFLLLFFGAPIIFFMLKNLKEIWLGRFKDIAESVHKIVSQSRKLRPWKQRLKERFKRQFLQKSD